MKVVICGAGVIGASLAYFLAQRGVTVTIIDRCGVATAASRSRLRSVNYRWRPHKPHPERD